MSNIDNLRNAVRNAVADGYVADFESREIQKYALKDDNTVTYAEKAFLRDVFNPNNGSNQQGNVFFTPRSKTIMQRLTTYGDNKISDEMNELRRQKQSEHWFNDEYVNNAVPVLVESTDSIDERINQLDRLKTEAHLFNNDYQNYAKEIIINSNDPIYARMEALRDLKNKVGMFNSEYQEIGKQVLLNSFDAKSVRLSALRDFSNSAGLWNSDYQEIANAINNDD